MASCCRRRRMLGPAGPLPPDPAIMYAGSPLGWFTSRRGLSRSRGPGPVELYGPPDLGPAMTLSRPFALDGVSVICSAPARWRIALCLHEDAHRQANCPTMRLFEAAAAGALIITDDFEFPRYWFRNSVLHVDAELPAEMLVQQIVVPRRMGQAESGGRKPPGEAVERTLQAASEPRDHASVPS